MIALGKEEDYVVFYVFIGVYHLNFYIFIYFFKIKVVDL